MVNRLLLTGRDALDQAVSKFLERREAIQREEDEEAKKGGGGRGGAMPGVFGGEGIGT